MTKIPINDILFYLRAGPYTQLDDVVRFHADRFYDEDPQQYISNANKYIREFNFEPDRWMEDRRSTASQIIRSGYITGSADKALVLTALSRAADIPAIYVETVNPRIISPPSREIGTAFVDLFISEDSDEDAQGQWVKYNPGHGLVFQDGQNNYYDAHGSKCIVIGKGLDFGHLYKKKGNSYETRAASLLDTRDIIKELTCSRKVIAPQKHPLLKIFQKA